MIITLIGHQIAHSSQSQLRLNIFSFDFLKYQFNEYGQNILRRACKEFRVLIVAKAKFLNLFSHPYSIIEPNLTHKFDVEKIRGSFSMFHAKLSDMEELDHFLSYVNLTLADVSYLTAETCDEYIMKCRWQGRIQSCGELFQRTFTMVGICCHFNFEENYQ